MARILASNLGTGPSCTLPMRPATPRLTDSLLPAHEARQLAADCRETTLLRTAGPVNRADQREGESLMRTYAVGDQSFTVGGAVATALDQSPRGLLNGNRRPGTDERWHVTQVGLPALYLGAPTFL